VRRAFSFASVLLLQSCGFGWHRTDLVTPSSPGQEVEVWQGDSSRYWHAVRVSADSVSGVPQPLPTACDSCRRSIARIQVDSVRAKNSAGPFCKTMTAVILIPAVLILGTCVAAGCELK